MHLKRFIPGDHQLNPIEYEHSAKKLDHDIEIPEILFLNEEMWPDKHYRLVSMIEHKGTSMNEGHYVAIGVSNFGYYCAFDDEKVKPVLTEDALQSCAHVLFYQLENEKAAADRQTAMKSNEEFECRFDDLINYTGGEFLYISIACIYIACISFSQSRDSFHF